MNLIEKVKEEFWPKLKTVVSKIPFTEDLIALYYSMMDPETPFRTKLIIAGALIYFISPLDAIPDFIPGAGFLDDAGVIAAVLASVQSAIREEHRIKAREFLEKK
ncbi:YkvA family protein [Leptospira interrogans]|uniref:DUF1232 domain-containing protein n=22 Tax=Leptospira interrogans TaxID=173 RepID=Q8F9G7_LEPIN|nr:MULTISPECIES: YkvA family protein [Leptospira]APH40207.1 Uncharacterized protein A9P81_0240 [Leptospira interrogans serovar Copenhageni/Icterohaemorrhagiae]EMF43549.1 PF06803 family protein [Leptospira interrogans serovar Lora str. TE 1992]EMF72397.1 PF06803 family protein [Leptospira interrogans serovar Canicola str. LT1962]EMG10113.1 PF06803 family protein [Leptospira interrogans serovar Grippotyphosa str. LT2186]EMG21464.1 PF06803 family protein [Leptospira interrogans serovar Copenhagen